jgi:hypothetical protein
MIEDRAIFITNQKSILTCFSGGKKFYQNQK